MADSTEQFERAFLSTERVRGYTHDFYKYPARFSPRFARFFIDSLTEPGDCILDPFMGGGTTIVEAAASGRYAIGSDVNKLAQFITTVKTTPLSSQDVEEVRKWVADVRGTVSNALPTTQPFDRPIRNMPDETYPFFVTAIELLNRLRYHRRRQFARCALLRVGQWALDARLQIPDTAQLCDELERRVDRMLVGMKEFVSAAREAGVEKNRITGARRVMGYSAGDSALTHTLMRNNIRPKLVITSPPYPGVHVLYHRWQVRGRRETPAPYWIANIQDGHGASYYTMGSRSALGLRRYFRALLKAFTNLRQLVDPNAKVVQLVSFSDSASQLPRYLNIMQKAGFEETSVKGVGSIRMRSVPNRKWYTQSMPASHASHEMLLIHRLTNTVA